MAPFCRRYLSALSWKKVFILIGIISLGNALVPSKWQVITLTNDELGLYDT